MPVERGKILSFFKWLNELLIFQLVYPSYKSRSNSLTSPSSLKTTNTLQQYSTTTRRPKREAAHFIDSSYLANEDLINEILFNESANLVSMLMDSKGDGSNDGNDRRKSMTTNHGYEEEVPIWIVVFPRSLKGS